MEKHKITKDTLDNLKSEFTRLTGVDRLRIIEEIKVARANGDLSENADYESALNQQKFIETRIQEIKNILDNYVLISGEDKKSSGIVKIGSKVKILEIEDNVEHEYEILGSVDNNPDLGRISNECPLARSILGKKVGDVIEIHNILLPYTVKILSIS